jgi:hypothetical protein
MLRFRSQTCPPFNKRNTRPGRLGAESCRGLRTDNACLTMLVLSAIALLTGASPSYAQSDHDGELDKWVPSVGIELDFLTGHTGKGNISSTQITGPRVQNPPPQRGDLGLAIVDPQASREPILAALVGGTFEIMTPQLLDVPSHPRLFLGLNVSAVFGSEVNFAVDADPGDLEIVEERSEQFPVGEASVIGRGSIISAQPQGPQVHAGFGVAFTVDVGTNRFRIKPSIVYSRIRQDIFAITKRVIRLSDANGPTSDLSLNNPEDFRLFQAQASRTEIYHGAGLALELEYDTENRLGPLSVTLFSKFHAAHLFGDLKTRFSESNPDYPGETVFYKFSQDRWTYRGGVGIRFRYVPRSRR